MESVQNIRLRTNATRVVAGVVEVDPLQREYIVSIEGVQCYLHCGIVCHYGVH